MLLRDRFDPRYYEPEVLFRYHGGWAGLSFSRASTATLTDRTGTLREVGPDVPRIDWSHGRPALRLEGGRVQKCVRTVNYAVNGLAGWSLIGDPAATLTVVDDPAALAAAGLGIIVGDGKVLRLDNSAGTSNAYAANAGTVLNDTSVHTLSAYMRGSGTARLILDSQDGDSTNVALGGTYARYAQVVTPTAGTRALLVRANPGAVVYFVLPQLEKAEFASSVIPNSGNTTVTRATETVTAPWPHAPQAMTVYARFHEAGTIAITSGFPRIVHIGAGTGARLVMYCNNAGRYGFDHFTAAGVQRSVVLATGPSIGQTVELLGTLYPDGSVQLEQSIDGGSVTATARSAATALSSAWSAAMLSIGSAPGGGNAGQTDLLDLLILRGAGWTMDQVRAYLPGW